MFVFRFDIEPAISNVCEYNYALHLVETVNIIRKNIQHYKPAFTVNSAWDFQEISILSFL